MSSAEQIGFVGLGAMGSPIATALLDAGHALAIHDRRSEAMAPLLARGATACGSPAEVAQAAAVVFVSLPTPDIVHAVALGPAGVIEGTMAKTFVDLSTTGPRMLTIKSQHLQATDSVTIAVRDSGVGLGPQGAKRLFDAFFTTAWGPVDGHQQRGSGGYL